MVSACAIIRPCDRRDYLDALAEADEGDFNSLIQLVTQRTMATLNKYLIAQRDAYAQSEWASKLIAETTARTAESRRLSYLRWARKAEEVRYEFQRCAALVTRLSGDVDIQFRPYDLIDEPSWGELRSGGSVSKNWFRIHFQQRQRHLTYIFFWGSIFGRNSIGRWIAGEPSVCLLLSEFTTARMPIGSRKEMSIFRHCGKSWSAKMCRTQEMGPGLEREAQDFESPPRNLPRTSFRKCCCVDCRSCPLRSASRAWLATCFRDCG